MNLRTTALQRLSLLGLAVILCVVSFRTTDAAAVMSVDLGSEWMKIGIVSPGVPMEIALNKESKRKTPSVVAFRDGMRTFGEDAQTLGLRFPATSYGYLIDLLGKTTDNPIVELYKQRFPYYQIEADPVRNTVIFVEGETRFSIEELVAQLLQTAKEFAETAVAQPITECVITVPGFFGQAERLAMLAAAQLANVKVLQLINDYAAVALNYGVFQRKEINETASYYMFYDMGAYKTTASLVSYQLVKDKQTRELTPVITVLGVAHDRTLGGLEMQLRLRNYLAKQFNDQKKTPTDVFTNARAMAKLFKEAGRVKNVLSANADHYAQIEGLLDEKDFKSHVTREKFEELCADLFDRAPKVLEEAIKASGLSLSVVNQVVLFGGNTRVPKVQETLKKVLGRELAKNLNSDEAATMGAVYKAADLGTGFKVKRYVVKDAVLYPIQVTFDKEEQTTDSNKSVRRTLFGKMNPYPQKKVITFNKHSQDFKFNVNYDVAGTEREVAMIGRLNLTEVSLSGVKDALEKNVVGDKTESKGIKAHFALDESGVFSVVNVELVVEKTVTGEEDDEEGEDKNPFSILGSTISKLFSKDKEPKDGEEEKPEADGEKPEEVGGDEKEKDDEKKDGSKGQKEEEAASNKKEKDEKKANETVPEDAAKANKTVEPKIKTLKHKIENEVRALYTLPLDGDDLESSRKKIDQLNKEDKERHHRDALLNELESFVVNSLQKLDEEEYKRCATEEEAEKVREQCSKVSDWLYEDGSDADAKTYEKKLKELKKLTNDIYARHWEHQERPEALASLEKMLEQAKGFLKTSKNFTKESNAEMDVFTAVEIETLEKLITKTDEWKVTEKKAQDQLKPNEPIRLTVQSMIEKMQSLDRELKYMANKMKYWKPKAPKKTEEKKAEEKVEGAEEEAQKEIPVTEEVDEGTGEAQVEEPVAAEQAEGSTTTTTPEGDDATPRGEL